MTPYTAPRVSNHYYTVYQGDALEILRSLPDCSVQCCVTSPPYYGLRDYGVNGQIGLEATPEQYIARLVEVFREVRRVLKNDGTCWVNMGDSYANSNPGSGGKCTLTDAGRNMTTARYTNIKRDVSAYKPKDLIGIPWMLAFALRADGFYLRQDIIWHKPNPMPESVKDRCTKAHEYVFLLSKNERYYYDAEAIAEPANTSEMEYRNNLRASKTYDVKSPYQKNFPYHYNNTSIRNRRSVWTIATQPYPGDHFATFPEALIEPCILAGSKPGDTILDPFAGSGTTLAVAMRYQRHGAGIELNEKYIKLIRKRLASVQIMATELL